MTKPYTGVTRVRKLVVLFAALALVFAFSVPPAEANHQIPPVVVDRTAFTLVYGPAGAGTSTFAGALSWRFDRTWDLLLSYSSFSGGFTAFRLGGRYHLRAPSPATDVSLNVQYFSEAGPSRTG